MKKPDRLSKADRARIYARYLEARDHSAHNPTARQLRIRILFKELPADRDTKENYRFWLELNRDIKPDYRAKFGFNDTDNPEPIII